MSTVQRTSLQLYRDCLRLVRHIAPGESPKSLALRSVVQKQFRKNQTLQNEDDIENAKISAIRALSNYMLTNSATKDPKISSAVKDYHGRSIRDAKSHDNRLRNNNNPNDR